LRSSLRGRVSLSALLLVTALTAPATAFEQPAPAPVDSLLFRDPTLDVSALSTPAATAVADPAVGGRVASRLRDLGVAATTAHVDLRTGRFATLFPGAALLPGRGVGNRLTWAHLQGSPPRTDSELAAVAWAALAGWLERHAGSLGIDPDEVTAPGRVTVLPGDLIQIWSPRRVGGVAVRGAYLQATIKHGNLILFGTVDWGDLDPNQSFAVLSSADAQTALARHVDPFSVGERWKEPELTWVPTASAETLATGELGRGLDHRLAWTLRTTLGQPGGRYLALVDAQTGQVLSIEDTVQHAATSRTIEGGVLPVSNDGVAPDGIEQADWPLPFATVTTPTGAVTTDLGGNLPLCVDGNISASLSGRYLTMNDQCGASSLTSSGDLDFGTSAGTNCTTPGIGGAGNTHASRSGYFEINMIQAMARSHLPANPWLDQQLTATMNIANTCNATWDGTGVNFYRSGGGCANTGEIAGVFDHEWGHGMDDNDANPTISSPGEGIADIYASLRLNTSCIGRNFRPLVQCGGYGNPCTACTGVRDIDWAKHTANAPFTIAQADACSPGPSNGPCGGSVHCEGQLYSQAVWDLWNRDLVAAPYNLSLDVAREIATQLTYRGAGGVGAWYACSNGTGGCGSPTGCGCGATGGYLQYLAADDDNGNLLDGTPHMQAIFAAFNRHNIACATPTVTTSGCTGTPTTAPALTATSRDRAVALSWTASPGATGFRIYRTDGVFGCDFGKQLVATVPAATGDWVDRGLKNGRTYSYQVVPMGADDACFAVASSCTAGTPSPGANFAFDAARATLVILNGDRDAFLDNCEYAQVSVPVWNIGNTTLTNPRIVAVTSPSHPATTVVTALPVALNGSATACSQALAEFEIVGTDLDPGETLTLDVEVTADELLGDNRVVTVSFRAVEADFAAHASRTFTFESDTEGWETSAGTFTRSNSGGGASATSFYLRSSNSLDDQCDVVRSPLLRLSATSTMTLFTNYAIEGFDGQWWDRANIGLRPEGSADRTVVAPSAGRVYNASGVGGTCGTTGQSGWASSAASWASSTWSAAALQSATFAGQPVRLEMRYGTDAAVAGTGLRFDQVTLTDFELQVADTLTNNCALVPPPTPLHTDDFEGGTTATWNVVTP
jgi:hypothetical protein